MFAEKDNMMKFQSRKEERKIANGDEVLLSDRRYNAVIGILMLYGLLVHAVMVQFLSEQILQLSFAPAFFGIVIFGFGGIALSWKSKNAFVSFLGYTLLVISLGISIVFALQGQSQDVVVSSFGLTAMIALGMIILSSLFPDAFKKIGMFLFAGLLCLVIAEVACFILQIHIPALSVAFAVVISLYIGYDWMKAQSNVKTLDNAVDSALDIYLDLVVLFLKLLKILERNSEK